MGMRRRLWQRFKERTELGFVALGLFVGVAWLLTFLAPQPVEANATVDKWKSVALSDVGFGQRLIALEQIQKVGGSDAATALADIAEDGDLPIAAAACAQLGRMKTSGSRTHLKGLVTASGVSDEVRMAAASAIAEHWKASSDLTWLKDKSQGQTALAAHVSVIEKRVYGN